jgi:hypothetical protein
MIYMKEGAARLAKVPPAQRINIKWLAIKNSHLLGALPMNLTWGLGFFLLVIVPLPMDMVALSMAPQSIVYPLGTAVTVIVGQVVAPKCFFKTERLNLREWAGTAMIIAGACIASAFGARKNESYKVDDILFLYTKIPFLLLLGLSLIVFIVALYLTHNIERHKIRPTVGMMCVAFVPSYLCGIQTISFKSMSELTSNAIAHGTGNNSNDAGAGTSNEWGGPMPWVFLAFVIACAAVQMIYINVGAAKYQATRFFPTYNATLMVCTCTFGAVFFEEYNFWGELAPLFPLGVLVIIVGIALLSWDDPTDQTTARVAPAEAAEAAEGGGGGGRRVHHVAGRRAATTVARRRRLLRCRSPSPSHITPSPPPSKYCRPRGRGRYASRSPCRRLLRQRPRRRRGRRGWRRRPRFPRLERRKRGWRGLALTRRRRRTEGTKRGRRRCYRGTASRSRRSSCVCWSRLN